MVKLRNFGDGVYGVYWRGVSVGTVYRDDWSYRETVWSGYTSHGKAVCAPNGAKFFHTRRSLVAALLSQPLPAL
jgi:hypothetical protein